MPSPADKKYHNVLVRFALFLVFLTMLSTSAEATSPTPQQIREYVKNTYQIVDASDQVLDMVLGQSPIPGSASYLSAFGYFMKAESIINDLYQGNYTDAIGEASSAGIEWAISDSFMGQVLTTPLSVARLATLPIQFSLNAFLDQIQNNAWNTQIKLYIAARKAGMSHAEIMQGSDNNGLAIFFFDGWLFSVGDLRVPPLGLKNPDNYTREQVYGVAQAQYTASENSVYYQRDKETAGADFKKILNPGMTYSPAMPTAPADISFSADAGAILNGITIASYAWNFGDGSNGAGQAITHNYRAPGTYGVTLTMTDSNNATHVVSESVTVLPPPINVSYPNGYDSFKRSFSTPSSSNFKQYSWDYGDSSPSETGITQDHTFSTSGYYTVILTLTLNDDSTIQSQTGIFVGPGTRYIQGHTIYGNETWYSGGTYEVQGSITVAQGATLTIEPGVTVKFASGLYSYLQVNGTLNATGVTFTWSDEQIPWQGFSFSGSGASGSKLDNCIIEHANSNNLWGVIQVFDSSPTITRCTLNNNNADRGIALFGGSPIIGNNIISGMKTAGIYILPPTKSPVIYSNILNNNGYGIIIYFDTGSFTSPILNVNHYQNNFEGDINIEGNILSTLNWQEEAGVVIRTNGFSVSGNLKLPSGCIVKIERGASIFVSGVFNANGVTFTWADGQNNWVGIFFYGEESSNSKLENCLIEHAGRYCEWTICTGNSAIEINGSSPKIRNCTIKNGPAIYGITTINGSAPDISNNTISGFSEIGLNVGGNSMPKVTDNTITGNNVGISVSVGSGGTYLGNTISGNASHGFFYTGSPIITAINNNWGDLSGPLDDSDDRATGGLYNPNGLGNKVSDHVNYYPWIGSPPALTASPTGLTGVPRYTSAKLTWNANSEPTLSGYKIYYGAAPGAYGSPVVVDKLTAYKLTGLVNGSPSYIAISSLNSVGAESALSPEISVTPINKFAIDLTVAGSGKGNVLFTQGGTSCNTGCSVLVDPYANETIQSAASQYSLFKGLTGDLVSAADSVALYMDNDKTITASFDKDLDHNVLIELPTQKYYPSISAAYLDTSVENVLKTWGTDITDNIILNKDIAVTIKGGFNAGYTTNSGITTLHGTLKVRKGKLRVEKLVLQ